MQRPQIGGRGLDLQRAARPVVAAGPQRAARGRIETAGRDPSVDANIAVQRSGDRQHGAAGQLIDRDDAVEAEQCRKRGGVVGVERAADGHVGVAEVARLAGRIAVEHDAQQAHLAVEIGFGDAAGRRGGGAIDGEAAMHFGGRQPIGKAAEKRGRTRREFADHVGQSGKRPGVEIERHAAARMRRQFIDAATDREFGAAQLTDRQAIDLQRAGVELHIRLDGARVDAAERRLADVERDRTFARQFETVIGRGLGKRRERIEIEPRGAQLGIDDRRTRRCRQRIGKPSLDVLAIERGFKPGDREPVARDGDIAAGAERLGLAGRLFAAAAEPGQQQFDVRRIERRRTAEGKSLRRVVEPAAEFDLGESRRAEFETVEAPAAVVEMHIAAQRLKRGAADLHGVDADGDVDRHRWLDGRHQGFKEALDDKQRRPVCRIRIGERAVDIDLQRRHRAVEMRLGAEFQFRLAADIDGALVRTVLNRDIGERSPGRRDRKLCGGVPGIVHHPLAVGERDADQLRQRQRAVEVRLALLGGEGAVDVGRQRPIGGIDAEPDAQATAGLGMAAGQPITERLVAGDETAIAFEWPAQRAHVAVERDIVQQQPRARRRVGENELAVLDIEPGNRQRLERRRHRRPIDRSGAGQPEADLRRDQVQLGGLDLAAQQRAEAEFKRDGVGAQLRFPAGHAGFDAAQFDQRRRQDSGVDRAVDVDVEARQAAGLVLEGGAVTAPVDDQRRDQRGDDRHDHRDCQSEQRRLHGASRSLLAEC